MSRWLKPQGSTVGVAAGSEAGVPGGGNGDCKPGAGNTAVASGGWMAPDSIAFHSIDHPSVLQHLSHQWSPWVSETDIRDHGIAIVCLADDKRCLSNANTMFPGFKFRALTIKGIDYGLSHSRTHRFRYFLVPPRTTNIQRDNVLHTPRREPGQDLGSLLPGTIIRCLLGCHA